MDIEDPDVRRAFDRLKQADAVALAFWMQGSSDKGQPVQHTDEQLLEKAKAEVAKTSAWRTSPEGRFFIAMDRATRKAAELRMQAEQALSARSRSWLGELRNCDVRTQEVLRMAKEIVNLANDALCAIEDQSEALKEG